MSSAPIHVHRQRGTKRTLKQAASEAQHRSLRQRGKKPVTLKPAPWQKGRADG